jgi:hypothetical protein
MGGALWKWKWSEKESEVEVENENDYEVKMIWKWNKVEGGSERWKMKLEGESEMWKSKRKLKWKVKEIVGWKYRETQWECSGSESVVEVKRKLQVTMEVKGGSESDIVKCKLKGKVEVKWQKEMEDESDEESERW